MYFPSGDILKPPFSALLKNSLTGISLAFFSLQEYKETTCHFQGDYAALSALAKQLLGVDLDDVKKW